MAKAIMIQGTMSNAGKSLLAAGLCRIFKQDGYRVAPFKSQNMALNSFITEEGLEMGRAQVMQAEAAGIRPSVLMNPILLKPTNDVGSQVIVNGEVLGNMSARDYFAYKKKLIPDIMKAYDTLAAENDIIVIEGAGSPAEINLKQDDIVNMGMAKLAKAPVLLVGDIDRGGVFAQLIGTVMLLEDEEKEMVKGLIINKFRGDKTILDPGVEMLEERSGIPVVGVAPYLQIEVEDEDSLTERFDSQQEVGQIDIAVIRVPRISNFTDFNPFENIPGVSLRYVKHIHELKHPDMVILPGTKNTMGDLQWMRESGMEAAVLKLAAAGTVIFGVCGGYQMLGETLSDPDGVEAGGTMKGMGLLPMDTVFADGKTEGSHCSVCGTVLEKQNTIAKVPGTIYLTASSLKMKTGQSTTAFKATGFSEGDYVTAVTSNKPRTVKVTNVNKNGTFKLTAGKKKGSAVVTVTLASKKTASFKVTVQKAAVKTTKITTTTKSLTLAKGATYKKLASSIAVTPVTSKEKVTYSSSNKKVATVSSKGVIKAKKAGTAKITVKSGSKKVVVTVKVTGVKTTNLSGVPAAKSVSKGKSFKIKAIATPKNTDEKITFKSSNKKVVTVTSKGVVKGLKKGTATITVQSGSKKMTCKVTVK